MGVVVFTQAWPRTPWGVRGNFEDLKGKRTMETKDREKIIEAVKANCPRMKNAPENQMLRFWQTLPENIQKQYLNSL